MSFFRAMLWSTLAGAALTLPAAGYGQVNPTLIEEAYAQALHGKTAGARARGFEILLEHGTLRHSLGFVEPLLRAPLHSRDAQLILKLWSQAPAPKLIDPLMKFWARHLPWDPGALASLGDNRLTASALQTLGLWVAALHAIGVPKESHAAVATLLSLQHPPLVELIRAMLKESVRFPYERYGAHGAWMLDAESLPLRMYGVHWVRQARFRPAVEALIRDAHQFVQNHPTEPTAPEHRAALRQIVGKDPGPCPEQWQEWWRQQQGR